MPPLASRPVRTSRAARSQRVSWSARHRLAVGHHERRRRRRRGEAELRAQLQRPRGLGAVRAAARRSPTRPPRRSRRRRASLAHPPLARDQRLAREQLAQRLQVIVVGLPGERPGEALAARQRGVDLIARVVVLQRRP